CGWLWSCPNRWGQEIPRPRLPAPEYRRDRRRPCCRTSWSAHARRWRMRSQRMHLDGLAGIKLETARRPRFEFEDELLATSHAEDHGRREFLLLSDEGDGGGDVLRTGIAGDGNLLPQFHLGELRFRHEEAHIDVPGRQHRNHRRHRGRIFAFAEI